MPESTSVPKSQPTSFLDELKWVGELLLGLFALAFFALVVVAFLVTLYDQSVGITTVTITNKLQGDTYLYLHCRAKGADLEVQKLPRDWPYAFQFKVHVWSSKSYWCSFSFRESTYVHDLYVSDRDGHSDQYWRAEKDGLCQTDSKGDKGEGHKGCLLWENLRHDPKTES